MDHKQFGQPNNWMKRLKNTEKWLNILVRQPEIREKRTKNRANRPKTIRKLLNYIEKQEKKREMRVTYKLAVAK